MKFDHYKGLIRKILGPELQNLEHYEILLIQSYKRKILGPELQNFEHYEILLQMYFILIPLQFFFYSFLTGRPAERLLAPPGPFTSISLKLQIFVFYFDQFFS